MADTRAAAGCRIRTLPAPPPICAGTDALFLDLDGTLATIEPRPDMVALGPTMRRLLGRLAESLQNRIAIVSGRTTADVERITAGTVDAVAGIHGLERRIDGEVTGAPPAPGLRSARADLEAFAAERPGVLIEDKGISVALHYRQAPEVATEARHAAERLAAQHGLVLQTGKMVYELRTPGADKAAAVAMFMQHPRFAASRPWFVGDDDTDEVAFRAVQELGGAGVLVGDARPTFACFRLDGVEAVEAWLATAVEGEG